MSSTEDLLLPSDTRIMSLWLVWSTLMRPLKPRPMLRNLQARAESTVHAGGIIGLIQHSAEGQQMGKLAGDGMLLHEPAPARGRQIKPCTAACEPVCFEADREVWHQMRNVDTHWLNLLLVFSCSAALMACCVASLASMPVSSSSALPSKESCSSVKRSKLPVNW